LGRNAFELVVKLPKRELKRRAANTKMPVQKMQLNPILKSKTTTKLRVGKFKLCRLFELQLLKQQPASNSMNWPPKRKLY
tara:strand:- start:163 stop:402 length:240 start_codon:yes stop_codon:yes gene_type:complete